MGEACSVPVNFHLTAGEIAYIAGESGARLAFVDSTTREAATAEAVAGTRRHVRDGCPTTGSRAASSMRSSGDRQPIALRPDQRVLPNLLFTSGTTGRPKAVQLPPKTIGDSPDLAGFVDHITAHRLAKLGPHLVVGPLYHNGPLTAVRLLLAGVPVVVHERFDAEATLAAIDRARDRELGHGADPLRALPGAARPTCATRYDVSSLRQVAHTGGKCPIDVKRAMIEWWGPVLSESYGGTESGTVCSINSTDWLAHPGSVGRAVPPFEALVVDDDGNELPPNTEGRLYFRDTTGRGIVYEGDPQKTADAHLAPGVFTLGEIGYVDDDGFVFITDRFSDMVVSGGVNIYPAEAEQVLDAPSRRRRRGVRRPARRRDGRAARRPRPARARRRRRAAVARLAWCRESLAGYKCPKEFRFVDEIPRNPMGKIDKRALRSGLLHENLETDYSNGVIRCGRFEGETT